jgi:long-chain acyl-CoA synthetase
VSHDWYKFYPEHCQQTVNTDRWTSISDALEQACSKFENKIALTCMGADVTFRQFNRLADQFAAYLQNDLGLKKGDRLAIMIPNLIQFPVAFFAAQKIGVICVNTNPLYTPREMQHQFKDSGAKAIVIVDLFMNNLEKCIKDTDIEHVIVTSIGDQLPKWKAGLVKTVMKFKKLIPKHNLQFISFKDALKSGAQRKYQKATMKMDDIAVLQYTGGTTGVSKGAMLLQRNILANVAQIQNCAAGVILEGEETVMTALPLYHIFALSVNFLTFVCMGQRMVLIPKPIPVENMIKIFNKYEITAMTGVNTLFNSLLNDPSFVKNPPKSLKMAMGGGMAVQKVVNNKWQSLTGLPIVEGFGLTETAPVTHVNPMNENIKIGSIGLPVASTDAKVVDTDGNEVANGETGELTIKGPQVMPGYWQRPDETAKTIKDGWLWTGDMAKRDDDGYFYIVDRKKDMILVSGFNVYPNEVEGVIVGHPKVLEAAVIGVDDEKSGEAVKAFVVAKEKSLTVDELKAFCADQLTGYKRPRQYVFIDDLPKSNVGKILRRELRETTESKPQS